MKIVSFIMFSIKNLLKIMLNVLLMILIVIILLNLFVIISTYSLRQDMDKMEEQIEVYQDYPILVLGAGVINNERPSQILANRLDKVVELHELLPDNPIIVSGDHMDQYYNEVKVMKEYLIDKGIHSQQIYLDHAGYSTYESLFRAKKVLNQDKLIIVTQAYHLPRSLMIAKELDIEAIGISAPDVASSKLKREVREMAARIKDFGISYFQIGIPEIETDYTFKINGQGDDTNIKEQLMNDNH